MRKYVQVILVVLSIFSLVSLLVYRHEYNKLRYVLEVLNFFGTPGVVVNGSCSYNYSGGKFVSLKPPPAWQRVSNTIYVYSAYYDEQEERNGVKAIAIGILNENLNYGCYLWYDGNEEPTKGIFSFSGIPKKNAKTPSRNSINSKYFSKTSKNKGYFFLCNTNERSRKIIGVTFSKTNDETAQAYLPVSIINKAKPAVNSSAICVLPVEAPFLKQYNFLEFLGFHQILGVNDYFIFGGEYLHSVLKVAQQNPHSSLNIENLQWNYPFVTDYDLMRTVADSDCLLRTKGLYEFTISLNWNQFIVPKFHSNINSIFHDFDPETKVSKFQLPVVLFCLEYSDDPKSTEKLPLVFRKSRYALLKSDTPVVISRSSGFGSRSQKVSREIAAVHWYTTCDIFDLKVVDKTQPKFDHSILRFNNELMESTILKVKEML